MVEGLLNPPLVHNRDFECYELNLHIKPRGFAIYAFSFTGCVKL